MKPLRYHPEAAAELTDAVDWYDERELGLGDAFLQEMDRALDLVRTSPATWPFGPGSDSTRRIRRFLLSRFPYAIAYELHADAIVVVAVAHLSRRPHYWDGR